MCGILFCLKRRNVPDETNDGDTLLNILSACETDEAILDVFQRIQGPYAFVFIQVKKKRIWFARDVFGRRSLTFCLDSDRSTFLLSSVVLPKNSLTRSVGEWQELSSAGIYTMHLTNTRFDIHCWPWLHNSMQPNNCLQASVDEPLSLHCMLPLNMTISSENGTGSLLVNADPLHLAAQLLMQECDGLLDKLSTAVARRVVQNSYFCPLCSLNTRCSSAHVAVMFSGGIDSVMLAHLAHQFVPKDQPIDLLNVAFQTGTSFNFDVPDRKGGWQALSELSPNRKWNFIEINVTREELQSARAGRISSLIQPLDSVLDDSIGCALWFASRGVGCLNETPYISTARVVLSGLGADEQLGGYSRHRSSFIGGGEAALLNEINLDLMRISSRNLGRDDRVVSDHGKEARFPFLDEEVVSFLNQLPVSKKMDLRLPRGVGEKLLLRACAMRCGLSMTAHFAKRAIQFGSRIAKCENRKEKGSDVCVRLTNDAISCDDT
ncbi:asparagine synthetase domain-containing protein 1-like isoform X2 [Watersipora subatra]|uniref:asparagine synthetase domain-containing protein 1-like isoform X2 n=1 Tax=Watersipora subatra TaxID=2589382 RepID=UPI00355C7672